MCICVCFDLNLKVFFPFVCRLFVDGAQLSAAVKGHLCVGEEEGVRTLPYHSIAEQLTQLQRKVWVSPHAACGWPGISSCCAAGEQCQQPGSVPAGA